MSLFALFLLAQAATTPPPEAAPDDGDEIVILARKLKLVQVHLLRTGHGQPGICTIQKSSGDAEVDKLTCEAAVACTLKLPSRSTPPAEMTACTREEQARRVEELADKRMQEDKNN
ncbi:hypothetical protein FJQ54_11790 [Sandaracinobacter neustonicus]|uniref:Uncharacterized protein n=1 Tax=Sandaracinobacter neustonicus TaxID=1715348 RepID=A0A501XI52_9SPHN|nr:hypothetical protein [Sandaracinobacter neustonicus]TPE60089.1 hypothetical protein FJQ54_11790 [Sandaracinobacter neustonicus]